MPTYNAARRASLADAAIALLAREGSRGLTHRAVDAEAGEPPGTTSRYFRTRDALLRAIVERVREQHFAELAGAPTGSVEDTAIADHLAGMVHRALTVDRARTVAAAELFLESTRRPALRAAMTATRSAQIQLMRDLHQRAGIALAPRQAAMLVSAVTGVIQLGLTTPEAIDLHGPEEIRDLVRAAVAAVHAYQPVSRR